MISVKAQRPSQPTTVAGPKSSANNVVTMLNTAPSQDRIRDRAYQLYQSRGCEAGQEQQDWLRAEKEILSRGK
jgi:hypothetical protein